MRILFSIIISLGFFVIINTDVIAQNFTRVDAGFPVAIEPANAWADVDNDGDLDVFITGKDELDIPQANVYINDGGVFSPSASVFDGTYSASCAFGDFNNDGLADIALIGMGSAAAVSKVYRNDGGGTFTDIGAGIVSLSDGNIGWGDYNNDGWSDLLYCGVNNSGIPHTLLYRNDEGNGFIASGISFTGLSGGDIAWSDIDCDEDLDFILCGANAEGIPQSFIFRNNNGSFSLMGAGLTGLKGSSASWGDFNNDSYPDLLLSGIDSENTVHTLVYKNNNGSSFTLLAGMFKGVSYGSGIWGDFNNDGMMDFIVAGQETLNNGGGGPPMPDRPAELLLYLNEGNEQFQEHKVISGGVENNAVSCGDYDNDSDLDLLVSGEMINAIGVVHENTAIFRNETGNTNNPPSIPDGLSVEVQEHDFLIEWNASTDDKTPSDGLNYNIRIGTQESNMDIFSALSDLGNGYRHIVSAGNVASNTSWAVEGIRFGEYYVSVQAIDPSFAGSGFSENVFLELTPTATFIAEDSICVLEETTITYTGNASSEAQYNWDFDGAMIVSGSGQGPYDLYWDTEGLKTLSLTVTENGVTSELFSHGLTVIAYPSTPSFIAGPGQLCQGVVSADFAVPPITGALIHEWSLNPPSAGSISGSGVIGTVVWNPDYYGTAYVFVRGMNYCGYGPYSDSLVVVLDPLPEKPDKPDGPAVLCHGGLNTNYYTNSSSFADGYQWFLQPESAGIIFSNGLQAEVIWNASFTGAAKVFVEGYNGCGSGPVSDTLDITVYELPLADAGDDQTIPYGNTTQLSGSASGGPGAYNYFWMPDSLLVDPYSDTPTTIPLLQSVQFVFFANDYLTSCTGSDQMVVTVTGGPLMIDALANPEQLCVGEEVSLLALASGGTGNYTYSWTSDPPGFISEESDPVAYPEETTTYYILVEDSGDEVSDSVLVIVDPLPAAAGAIYGAENVCAGDEGVLYSVDPVPDADQYYWVLDEGLFGSSDSASIFINVADQWIQAVGSISVTPVNSCGLGASSELLISVWDVPLRPGMISGEDTLCTTTDTLSTFILEEAVPGATDYLWEMLPEDAGYIVSDGMTASVNWVKNWDGEVIISVQAINDCGNSEWSEPLLVHAYSCLGINDIPEGQIYFSLYPNPADEVISVRCWGPVDQQELDLTIYDLFGRKMLETVHPGQGIVKINTSGFPAGMYILSLHGESGQKVSKRMVVQH